MNPFTDKQIQTLKTRLHEEKEALERHFEINANSGEQLKVEDGGELSAYDNHPADLGTETFQREMGQAIDENLDQKLAEVDAALARLEEGSYGLCELCRRPIEFERLEALPWTSTCLEHAGKTKGASRSADRYEMTAPILPDDADAWTPLDRYGSSDNEVPGQREE